MNILCIKMSKTIVATFAAGGSGLVILLILIFLLLPLSPTQYISFEIREPNTISKPSFYEINKPILTKFLEQIQKETTYGQFSVNVTILNLGRCPNYLNNRQDYYIDDCEIILSGQYTSLPFGYHSKMIELDKTQYDHIEIILMLIGPNNLVYDDEYERISFT